MGIRPIAFNTLREALRSKAYYAIVVTGVVMLLLWVMLPFSTQGNDLGLLKEMELGTITVLGVLLGILVAGTAVAEELTERVAMTLLSKPVTRSQFVAGKFFGVILTVLSAMVLMGAVLVLGVWLKAHMELEPAGQDAASLARVARERWYHVGTVLPGLAMAIMQALLVSAVAVTLATRLPLAVNALVVVAVYVLGHLLPALAGTVEAGKAGWLFLKGASWVLPSLMQFNVGNAVAFGYPVPWATYVLPALLYTVLYGTAALLVAMALFRERELT